MQETLQQYRERTLYMWNSLAQCGGLRTSDGLELKVDSDGHFKPFWGDTVIFSLPQPMISWLERIQTHLYAACGAYLAERIRPESFHITLHDLLSQVDRMPDGVSCNQHEVLLAIEEACGQYPHSIAIRSCCMFSMVHTSIVMGFEPASEYDCAILMALYERFQQIVPLSYPLTLHVTLAYYKPGEYDDETLLRLNEAMQSIGRERHEWQLDLQKLCYATFENMAQYHLVSSDDPWDLARFLQAQATQYTCALSEINRGNKQGHWIWYIFPQLRGLGHSDMSYIYGIENLKEAKAYLSHPVLGARLIEITRALLTLEAHDPIEVMGYPDNLKLHSCMTLFSRIEGSDPAFGAVIDQYYGGKPDEQTLALLKKNAM